MLFCSTSLAARIERAECQLVGDGTRAIARRRPEADALVLPIAGGVASLSEPGSPLNKLAGLGFAGELDATELEEVERLFAERGIPLQVELANLADPSIGALLTRRGYVLMGFENVLGRQLSVGAAHGESARAPGPGAVPLARTSARPRQSGELAIVHGEAADLATWLDVLVTGFATPDTQGVPSHESFPRELLERAAGDMAAADGFARYVALSAQVPVGAASLRLFEGVAHLCGATTLPAHRRRGVQSALLAARLADATREHCDIAVCIAQPGSKSHENVQKQGFDLLYTRAVLVRGA